MTQEFQKPIAAPPTLFGISLIVAIAIGFVSRWPILPWTVQLTLGPLLIAAGVLAISRSMSDIQKAGTTYDPFDVSTQLVTCGIYRFSRNPGYLGLALIQLGVAVLLDNVWIAIACLIAIWLTTHFVIRLEERKLTDAFGAPYTAYLQRVRRWI